jgi:hypothetical protein
VDTPVLASTFLLTLLLLVGLVFFIRASVKDRTETAYLAAYEPEDSLLKQLHQHFTQRAYSMIAVDTDPPQMTFSGFVRPSAFLAVFLTLLAAIGLFCLALVLSLLFHRQSALFLGLPILSPLAGFFYWKGAARPEAVNLVVQSSDAAAAADMDADMDDDVDTDSKSSESEAEPYTRITVTAHRDEVIALRQALPLIEQEAEPISSTS